MATETTIVTPDQTTITTTEEHVEKKVNDVVKVVEEDVGSPPEENGKKDVELAGKPQIEDLSSSQAPITESEEKKEDQQLVDPLAAELVEKDGDVPVSVVKEVDAEKVTEDGTLEQDVLTAFVPAVEAVGKEPEVVEPVDADDKVEVILPTLEPEVPKPDSQTIEQAESGAEVEEKTCEQPEVTEVVEVKSEVVEPKESTELDISKDEGKTWEVTVSSNEEPIGKDQVPVASENSDQTNATEPEAQSEIGSGEVSDLPEVITSTPDNDLGKVEEVEQPASTKAKDVIEVGEKLTEGTTIDAEEVKQDAEENNVKLEQLSDLVKEEVEEQKEEKNVKLQEGIEQEDVKVEEVKQSETTTKTEEASDSVGATEPTPESFEGEKISRDVELVPEENKEECIKDDIKTSVETIDDKDVDENTNGVKSTTTTASEPIGEPKELVSEENAKNTHDTLADKLEKTAEVLEENANSDVPNLESVKDLTDTKTEGDGPKEEIQAKPTQKQSSNIMSKVKQSIVKVKKAIIGKSPSSKTISSDVKTIQK